jgi:hypothetical protein
MTSPHDQWQKGLATTFSQELHHDQQLRVSWLTVLRSQCRNGGPAVPVKPEDEPLLQRLERRIPNVASIRLEAFLARLRFRAPDVAALQPDLWLMSVALDYQAGKFGDPCKPWVPRGPRRGSYSIPDEKLRRDMYEARGQLIRKGDPITQENLMRKMGYTGDTRRVREWCERLQISWRCFRKP